MNEHIQPVPFTEDEFYMELGWLMADKMAKGLLDSGRITPVQYVEISKLNRKSFSIISVDLLPNSLDITDLQR